MRAKREVGALSAAIAVVHRLLVTLLAVCGLFPSCLQLGAQQKEASTTTVDSKFMADVMTAIPPAPKTFPLYGEDPIPNSKSTPDQEILQAADDLLVDVDNSIAFFEALRHQNVSVDMTIFDKGEHGFFFLPRDRWETIIQEWLERNGWVR